MSIMSSKDGKINDAQNRFIDAYVDCLNRTAAYQKAYPKATYSTAKTSAHRLLLQPHIKAEVAKRLSERSMTHVEVLGNLTDIATGSMEDFLTVDDSGVVRIDMVRAESRGALKNIRKFTIKERIIRTDGEETIVERTIVVDLYDRLAALDKLAKYHDMFSETINITDYSVDVKALTDEELEKLIAGTVQ